MAMKLEDHNLEKAIRRAERQNRATRRKIRIFRQQCAGGIITTTEAPPRLIAWHSK